MGVCRECLERGKDWNGDDPKCAFPEDVFVEDNWNCALANAIRELCYEGQELPPGVTYTYCDDMKYATIRAPDDDDVSFMGLLVVWYKQRGTTEQIWAFGSHGVWPAKADECRAVLLAYGKEPPHA